MMISEAAVQDFISESRRIRQSIRQGSIIIIDDESQITEIVARLCEAVGEKAEKITTINEAHARIFFEPHTIKMAIIDYILAGETADSLIEVCQMNNVPCVIHTGRLDLVEQLQKKYPGIIIVSKPAPIERLLKEIL